MYRVGVAGSRTWPDPVLIYRELAEIGARQGWDSLVIRHGNRGNADLAADRFAVAMELGIERYNPQWYAPCRATCRPGHRQVRDGREWCPAAGMYRNEQMVTDGGVDEWLIYIAACRKRCRKGPHGSHGATGMAELAEAAGIPVLRRGQFAVLL